MRFRWAIQIAAAILAGSLLAVFAGLFLLAIVELVVR